MKVLVAGGTGVIGRPLVTALRAAGHEALALGKRGGDVQADALDAGAVTAAVARVRPDVLVHQLTAIPARLRPKRVDADYALTNRLRSEGTKNLIVAARAAGVKRFVAQSVAFLAEPQADGAVATEGDPVWQDGAPAPELGGALNALERQVHEAGFEQGLICRYGMFWGPGTVWDGDGAMTLGLRGRKLPIVGAGGGRWSFVHVDDAARATRELIESEADGVFQIVEDAPSSSADVLVRAAERLGAKRPRRVPPWLGRLGAGAFGVYLMTALRPASNALMRARGWVPTHDFMRDYPDWR